jgi:monoamine oxidase
VKRRNALQHIGGLTAGLALPSWLASCETPGVEPEIRYDGTVAVIGAGAAGLYAADILSAKGINVLQLEAGNELGGRLKSLRNQPLEIRNLVIADFPVELGAEIIYGSDSIAGRIATNRGLPLVDLDEAGAARFVMDNKPRTAVEWGADPDFVAHQNFVNGLRNFSGGGQSVRQAAAGVGARAQALVNGQVANLHGSSAERVGVQGIVESLNARKHDNKRLVLRGNPLQDLILSRFSNRASQVQRNQAVTSINYAANPVVITTAEGHTFEAGKVIVTVPVSVLKAGTIRFSPGLPGHITGALGRMGMDACVRVILEFRRNFWGDDTSFIWGGSSAIQVFNAGLGRSRFFQTTTITVYGPKAAELSALGGNMIPVLLAELDQFYGGQATANVRRDLQTNQIISVIQDWTREPHIRGGLSYLVPGATLADRAALTEPVNNRLFFAGEATDTTGDAGTLNGALASAERVALQVIDSIQNES